VDVAEIIMDNEKGVENETKQSGAPATSVDFDRPNELVGRCLDGRFMIEKNLAEIGGDAGGIGVVYLATDTKLMNKAVVVKILQEAALKHPDILRKFEHEKEALIRLDHPNIVRLLDTGTLRNGNPFMVMSYIKGHSLRKALRDNKQLPLNVVAHIIECVTDALSAAHTEKILHRDIKPENIMLTPQAEGFDLVQLIDFGIARVGESKLAPATDYSRAIGSVLYIAPEQLIGNLDLTPAADIYAVGIVAYEMLTGELPFKPKAIAEMYQLEKNGVQVPPSALRKDIPRVAEKILLSALEFDPEKRPQNARAFGRYLASELLVDEATDLFLASIKTEYAKIDPDSIPRIDPQDLATIERPKGFSVPVGLDPEPAVPEPVTTTPLPTPAKPTFNLKVIAAIIIALIAIPTAYFVSGSIGAMFGIGEPVPPVVAENPRASRQIAYYLMVQKMRDGKPFEAPFKSSGQEVYESGYRFTLNFQSDADGHIYVFNEGKDQQGNLGYFLIFPTLNVNNNSSKIPAGQTIETAPNGFGGTRGTEIMWLVWSAQKRDDLEAVWQGLEDKRKPVSDLQHVSSLRALADTYNTAKPESTKDTPNQRTVVRANGDLVVQRFELEHR